METQDKEQLLNKLKPVIPSVISEVEKGTSTDRLRLLSQSERNELYYRGLQDLQPEFTATGEIRWKVSESAGDEEEVERRSVNKIRGDGKKLITALGGRAPRVKAMPVDPRSDADRLSARHADLAAARLYRDIDAEVMAMRIVRGLWVTGTQFAYVRWVADGQLNGYVEEPVYESESVEVSPAVFRCPACGAETPVGEELHAETPGPNGEVVNVALCPSCHYMLDESAVVPAEVVEVPRQVGVKRYPKGGVRVSLADVTKIRVPLNEATLADCEYLIYEYDEWKSKLYSAIPGLRERLQNSGGDGSLDPSAERARTVRGVSSSPAGKYSPDQGKLTFTRAWMRPSAYEHIQDKAIREEVGQLFPRGLKATLVSGVLVDIEEEAIEDAWVDCPSETANTLISDPLCIDMIDPQDVLNDSLTIGVETFKRGLPISIVSPDIIDLNALREKPAVPFEFLPAKPGSGSRLEDGIKTLHPSKFPEELPTFATFVQGEGREATGILPQLWGGGSSGLTATEDTRRANQALAQLGMQWVYLRRFWARLMQKAVGILADKASFELIAPSVPGSDEAESIDTQAIKSGNFYFECEENIPVSWALQKEQLLYLIGQAPAVAEALAITDPANINTTRELLGLPMLVTPGEDQRNKVMETITELLKDAPVQNPETGELEPSIPVDEFEDDPAIVYATVRSWCVKDSGRKQRRENPRGYDNVVAYGKQAFARMQPPMPPPGMEQPGAAPMPGPPQEQAPMAA